MPHLAPLRVALAAATMALAGCCVSGERTSVWQHVTEHPGPLLIVYYPEHETWNSRTTSTVLTVDGERIARLCEGDFVALPVAPGPHVLSASTDAASFACRNTRTEPFPPLKLDVGNGPVLVRFGARPYPGPWSDVTICERRLTQVSLEKAQTEVDELGLVGERRALDDDPRALEAPEGPPH